MTYHIRFWRRRGAVRGERERSSGGWRVPGLPVRHGTSVSHTGCKAQYFFLQAYKYSIILVTKRKGFSRPLIYKFHLISFNYNYYTYYTYHILQYVYLLFNSSISSTISGHLKASIFVHWMKLAYNSEYNI